MNEVNKEESPMDLSNLNTKSIDEPNLIDDKQLRERISKPSFFTDMVEGPPLQDIQENIHRQEELQMPITSTSQIYVEDKGKEVRAQSPDQDNSVNSTLDASAFVNRPSRL